MYIIKKLTITSHIVIDLHIISGKIFKYSVKWCFISRSIWETRSIFLLEIVTHTVCVNILYIIKKLAISLYIVIIVHNISMSNFYKYLNLYYISLWKSEIRSIYLVHILIHTAPVNILYIITVTQKTSHIVIIVHIISGKIF